MLPRSVAQKTAVGATKGLAVGYIGGNVLAEVSNKIAGTEKWFDNTLIGRKIDNGK